MEKKEIKISLGTFICMLIIAVLVVVIMVMYFNSKNNQQQLQNNNQQTGNSVINSISLNNTNYNNVENENQNVQNNVKNENQSFQNNVENANQNVQNNDNSVSNATAYIEAEYDVIDENNIKIKDGERISKKYNVEPGLVVVGDVEYVLKNVYTNKYYEKEYDTGITNLDDNDFGINGLVCGKSKISDIINLFGEPVEIYELEGGRGELENGISYTYNGARFVFEKDTGVLRNIEVGTGEYIRFDNYDEDFVKKIYINKGNIKLQDGIKKVFRNYPTSKYIYEYESVDRTVWTKEYILKGVNAYMDDYIGANECWFDIREKNNELCSYFIDDENGEFIRLYFARNGKAIYFEMNKNEQITGIEIITASPFD